MNFLARVKGVSAIALLVMVIAMSGYGVAGAEERPEADMSMSLLSAYIWRGYELSKDSMVVQPSATVSYSGFSANIWGNWDTDLYDGRPDNLEGADNYNETDITFSYGHDFGMFSAEAGYIYYALSGADDSQEFYVSGALNVLLSPTLTIYREFAHYPSTYITLEVSHSFELPRGITLDLGLSGSYLASDDSDAYADPDDADDEYNNLHDGKFSVAMSIPLGSFLHFEAAQYISITPEIDWVFPLSGDASKDMAQSALGSTNNNNFVYGGATFSFSF